MGYFLYCFQDFLLPLSLKYIFPAFCDILFSVRILVYLFARCISIDWATRSGRVLLRGGEEDAGMHPRRGHQ